jgi:cytoskeletal protein CcmA (bactofilin family)
VFKGLFGSKSDRSPPPKNQIEVECPACGAFQHEPKLVVSTFCRGCGTHLAIDRGRVTATGQPPPAPPVRRSSTPAPRSSPEVTELSSPPPPPAAELPAAPTPLPANETPTQEIGFGAFLKNLVAQPAPPQSLESSADEAPAPAKKSGKRRAATKMETELGLILEPPAAQTAPQPEHQAPEPELTPTQVETPATPSEPAGAAPQAGIFPAQPLTTWNAGRGLTPDQGLYRQQYFREADCFHCGQRTQASRAVRSATCSRCGSTIPLDDIEVRHRVQRAIRTRGDVMIRRAGVVTAEQLECKDLRCYGLLETNVKTTGDVILRTTGTLIGAIQCQRLLIEKGSDITFLNEVQAAQIEVHARVTGSLVASGSLLIGATGAVNGDVTASSVSIQPGGELNGAMNIVRGKPAP